MKQQWSMTCAGCLVAVLVLVSGCNRAVTVQSNPTPVASGSYDEVFDATVETLREMRFVVDRQDRRFGVITTQPRTASTALAPWENDNTTGGQVVHATTNHQRRIVRVELTPGAQAAGIAGEQYELAVAVTIEQRQVPQQQLHTAKTRSLEFQGRTAGVEISDTVSGDEPAFWRPIARDEFLESRVIAGILERTNVVTASRTESETVEDSAVENTPADAG